MSRWLMATMLTTLTMASTAMAQTTDPTEPTLGAPRDNVTSGAISARAPGNWIRSGIANHQAWNDAAFRDFGGADIPEATPTPKRLPQAIAAAVQGLLDFFQGLVDDFQAALLANQLGQTAGG